MKKLLILMILLAAVSGTGLSVARAEEGAAPPKADAPKDTAKKEEGGEGGEGGGAKKPPADVSGGRFAGDPVYVHLDPMILPIITRAGAEQIVTLKISIEVKDFDAADDAHTNMPRVMDALMRGLYGGLSEGNLSNGVLVNIDKVKAKSLAALRGVLGDDNVKDVLIEAVAQRRL